LWTLPKKVHVGNGCARCFLEKTEKKSVKFGLGGRSNISLPRIGGSHPVPSLSLLSTERRGYSNVLDNYHTLMLRSSGQLQHSSVDIAAHSLRAASLLLSGSSCTVEAVAGSPIAAEGTPTDASWPATSRPFSSATCLIRSST